MQQLDLFGYIEQEKKNEPQKDPAGSDVNTFFVEPGDKKAPPKEITFVAFGEMSTEVSEGVAASDESITQAEGSDKAKSKRGRKSYKEIDAELVNIELPSDEELFKKQYYSISEVAAWFNVNTSLIRFWENEFDILKPRKTRKGDRLFRPEDVKNIRLIYYLLRQRKFSIEGAKKFLRENKGKAQTHMQLVELLTKFKSFLLEWKANLEV